MSWIKFVSFINKSDFLMGMEMNILEDKKNRLMFELKGETHTFCNILRRELWNDKHVKAAAYNIEHPLIGIPKMIVETDGKESPKKALSEATKRIKKVNDTFKKQFMKEVK